MKSGPSMKSSLVRFVTRSQEKSVFRSGNNISNFEVSFVITSNSFRWISQSLGSWPRVNSFENRWNHDRTKRLDNSLERSPGTSAARHHSERLSIEFIACISRAGDCTRRHATPRRAAPRHDCVPTVIYRHLAFARNASTDSSADA